MGSMVSVKCECGLQIDRLLIGGGMRNHITTCYFPCECKNCRNVVQANLLSSPLACPTCRSPDVLPYDQPELIGVKREVEIVKWSMKAELGRDLVLMDGLYKCPKCGNMTLRFFPTGLWD